MPISANNDAEVAYTIIRIGLYCQPLGSASGTAYRLVYVLLKTAHGDEACGGARCGFVLPALG